MQISFENAFKTMSLINLDKELRKGRRRWLASIYFIFSWRHSTLTLDMFNIQCQKLIKFLVTIWLKLQRLRITIQISCLNYISKKISFEASWTRISFTFLSADEGGSHVNRLQMVFCFKTLFLPWQDTSYLFWNKLLFRKVFINYLSFIKISKTSLKSWKEK